MLLCLFYLVITNLNIDISQFGVSNKLLNKTTSINGLIKDDNGRIDVLIDGITRLSFPEVVFGAGVSSVINSGPHNDFVRWTQRIGIFGAFLAFLPFLTALHGSYKTMRLSTTINSIFIFVVVFFTIYTSFFGYPREDAYQAPFVWFGFALWLYSKNDSEMLRTSALNSLSN